MFFHSTVPVEYAGKWFFYCHIQLNFTELKTDNKTNRVYIYIQTFSSY